MVITGTLIARMIQERRPSESLEGMAMLSVVAELLQSNQ